MGLTKKNRSCKIWIMNTEYNYVILRKMIRGKKGFDVYMAGRNKMGELLGWYESYGIAREVAEEQKLRMQLGCPNLQAIESYSD